MQTQNSPSKRLGFTLVELLIVIAIIGTLMALFLPAVNAARERARQLTCSTNLSQLAKATVNYGTSGKGLFPGWIQEQRLASAGYVDLYRAGSNPTPGTLAISWAAKLLPQLDQSALWEELLTKSDTNLSTGNVFDGGKGLANNPYDAPPLLEVFSCPSDVRPSADIGYLSYVANTGTYDLDWDGIPNQNDSNANGVFQNLLLSGVTAVRFGSDVKDGANTTLLLSENIHKDEALSGPDYAHTWLSSPYLNSGSPLSTEQAFGMVWVYEGNGTDPVTAAQAANQPSQMSFVQFNQDQDYTGNFIEAGGTGKPFARPASSHPELFITAFVEGNTRSINQNIEYRVYQQLMTPNGNKAVYAGLDKAQNEAMQKGFNIKQLSDDSY